MTTKPVNTKLYPEGMKHKEALYVRGVFGQPFQPVHRNLMERKCNMGIFQTTPNLYLLLPNGVVAPGVVVGGVLLAIDQLLRMVELTVGPNSGLVNDSGLQVNKDSSWNMFSTTGFGEEGLEGVISESLVGGHTSVRLDTMLQAVELPTGVSNLDSSLSDMNGDAEN